MQQNSESNATHLSSREPSSVDTYDEIDLIDVIGFLWRSRLIIGSCIALGFVSACGLWFAKNSSKEPATQTMQKTMYFPAINAENSSLAPVPIQLNAFLKTAEGARTFYEALKGQDEATLSNTEDLIVKQQAGQGILKDLILNEERLAVTLEGQVPWNDTELASHVRAALNLTIDRYNNQFAATQGDLAKEALDIQLKLGQIQLKAINVFDQHSSLSPVLKAAVIQGLMQELAKGNSQGLVAILISALPENNGEKLVIMTEYQKYYQMLENISKQNKSLASSLKLETLSTLPQLGAADNLLSSASTSHSAPAQKLIQKMPVVLTLGVLLGAMLGTFLALLRSFWTSNRQRLETIFNKA